MQMVFHGIACAFVVSSISALCMFCRDVFCTCKCVALDALCILGYCLRDGIICTMQDGVC